MPTVVESPYAGLLEQLTPTPGELVRARARLHRKAVLVGALVVVSYWALVLAPGGVLLKLAAAAALVLGLFATATCVMHDANHGAFARNAHVNRLAAWTADLLGASSSIWRFTHNNLHHGNTNVVGVDPDIDQAPFGRLTPEQPWKWWHRYQHTYLWFLYGFLALRWFLYADYVELAKRHRHPGRTRSRTREIAGVITGKTVHISWAFLIPLAFHRWWVVLTFYLVCSWLIGFALALVFQLAHCNDLVAFTSSERPRRGEDFVAHQLRTTADVDTGANRTGALVAWFVGGLHHQVEHHLLPRLPHTAYAAMAQRLRTTCRERGVSYKVHRGFLSAIASHGRWLRAMARPPEMAAPLG